MAVWERACRRGMTWRCVHAVCCGRAVRVWRLGDAERQHDRQLHGLGIIRAPRPLWQSGRGGGAWYADVEGLRLSGGATRWRGVRGRATAGRGASIGMALGVGAAVAVWSGDAVGWLAGGVVRRYGHGCVGEGLQTARDMALRARRWSRAGCS